MCARGGVWYSHHAGAFCKASRFSYGESPRTPPLEGTSLHRRNNNVERPWGILSLFTTCLRASLRPVHVKSHCQRLWRCKAGLFFFFFSFLFLTVNHRGPLPLRELHSNDKTLVWRDSGEYHHTEPYLQNHPAIVCDIGQYRFLGSRSFFSQWITEDSSRGMFTMHCNRNWYQINKHILQYKMYSGLTPPPPTTHTHTYTRARAHAPTPPPPSHTHTQRFASVL